MNLSDLKEIQRIQEYGAHPKKNYCVPVPSQSTGMPTAPIRRKVIQQRFLLPDGKDPFRAEYTVRFFVHSAHDVLFHKITLAATKSLFIVTACRRVR